MALEVSAGLLACPVCQGPAEVVGRTVACPAGHRFDVARQGYVNLLGTAPPANADTPAMVAARDRFLATGAFDPVRAALVAAAGQGPTVAEVGAGTAWYLAGVLQAGAERGVALDVSVAAARRAARAHPRAASVVADTWRYLPLRDGCLDALLCVFAPRNPAEFRRVLRPGGRLVVVHPGAGHLAALRRTRGLLDVDPRKDARVAAQLEGFTVSAEQVRYDVDATAEQVADLVAMGPNAFHATGPVRDGARLEVDVTVLTAVPG